MTLALRSVKQATIIARTEPGICGHQIAPGATDLATARIRRRKVLGGLIHEYQRAA